MFKVILILLIFGSQFVASAVFGVQTDWSGGPVIWGPVTEWTNIFYQEYGIDWNNNIGNIILNHQIITYNIVEHFDGGNCIYSEDIDGDGDMDVLCTAYYEDDITWFENIDGSGTSWAEHDIDENFDGAYSVYSEDIDGDGDNDVLGAAMVGDDITWWENMEGSGTSWVEHIVDGNFNGARSVYSEDIDGDGDNDILGAAMYDDEITWWENTNGSGTSWDKHTIDGDYDYANCVYSEDINGDGYMDILASNSGYTGGVITWWRNNNDIGNTWTEYTVDGFDGARYVYSQDFDGDGDMDILGTAYFAENHITWWENTDGSGTLDWIGHTIATGPSRYTSYAYAEDLDGDGDIDIVGSASEPFLSWWENSDGSGTSWIEHQIETDYHSVYSEDIDGDGDNDVLGAAIFAEDITWWALDTYPFSGSLESIALDTQEDPYWDVINWTADTPSGTSVSFQLRASDNYNQMGSWSDTLTSPGSLSGILNDGDRYMEYRVILTSDQDSITPILNDITISWNLLGIDETAEPFPQGTELFFFAPNPSSAPAARFGLTKSAIVELSVFDISGRLVHEIDGNEYSRGFHDILLLGLSPGVYFCRMISGDFKASQRFMVIK